MKNIYEVLAQKESQHIVLMSEYRKLGEAVSKLGRELDAIRTTVQLLADAHDQAEGAGNKELSQPQMLRAVLAENGTEMHLSAILKAVEKKFNKKLSPNVIAAVIFRYAKRGSIFYKASAPNTWGLLEFRGNIAAVTVIDGSARAS